jgi:hypothetical protein
MPIHRQHCRSKRRLLLGRKCHRQPFLHGHRSGILSGRCKATIRRRHFRWQLTKNKPPRSGAAFFVDVG